MKYIDWLIQWLENYIRPSVKVRTLYSGLRIGELIALQWSDIDFAKGILTVSKSCHDGGKPDSP